MLLATDGPKSAALAVSNSELASAGMTVGRTPGQRPHDTPPSRCVTGASGRQCAHGSSAEVPTGVPNSVSLVFQGLNNGHGNREVEPCQSLCGRVVDGVERAETVCA